MGNSLTRLQPTVGTVSTDQPHLLLPTSSVEYARHPANPPDNKKAVTASSPVPLTASPTIGSPKADRPVRKLCRRITSCLPGFSGDVGDVVLLDETAQTAKWRVSIPIDAKQTDQKLGDLRWQSPVFTLGVAGGPQLCWRLLVLCDHHSSALSCYLESDVNACNGVEQDFLYTCEYTMQVQFGGNDIGSLPEQVRGLSHKPIVQLAQHNLHHVFSRTEPAWGMQNLVSIADLKHMHGHTYEVQVSLHSLQKLAAEPQEDMDDLPHAAVQLCTSPKILLIDNFLEPELCDYLRTVAFPRLVRSKVSAGTETPSRTSCSTFFTGDHAKDPVVVEVERRIEQLFSHPCVITGHKQLVKTEALQVVRYMETEFYAEHYDNKAGGSISRAATIIIYLCETPAGGSTFFPRAGPLPLGLACPPGITYHGPGSDGVRVLPHSEDNCGCGGACTSAGLRIFPAMGRALVFWSKMPNGREDLCSIHAGEKVLQGEKWIATRWLKETE